MEQSYKEKYEDVLARLERAKNDNDVCDERFCCVIDDLIPELAESEDEKMMKEIIDLIMQPIWKTEKEFHRRNELCAWIKKQGQVKESTISQHENRTCEEKGNSLTYEDERIRKWLVNDIKQAINGDIYNDENIIDAKKTLVWLERQGEHANFRNKIQVGDKVTRNEDGILVNLSQLKRVAKPREKQCEQKPEMKTAEESLGIDSDTYNKIVDECIFGEQKKEENKGNLGGISPNSAWSEDEEAVLDALIRRLEGEDIYVSPHLAVKCLKSLKDRVLSQPKQKWSEEDEEILRTILSDGIRGAELDMLQVNWLKSLKDRVQPKPMCKFGDTELTNEELCEGLIRGMINEHNRVTKEILRNEYEKGRADVLAKIDAIDVDEMVCESGVTSRVTQYWYAHGVNDVIKKLKEEQV